MDETPSQTTTDSLFSWPRPKLESLMCRAEGVPVTRLHSNMLVMDTRADQLSIMAENKLGGSRNTWAIGLRLLPLPCIAMPMMFSIISKSGNSSWPRFLAILE